MADFIAPCNECGRIFNQTKLERCPGCARNGVNATPQPSRTRFGSVNSQPAGHDNQRSTRTDSNQVQAEPIWAKELASEMRLNRLAAQSTSMQIANLAAFLWLTLITSALSGLLLGLGVIFKPYDVEINPFFLITATVVAIVGTWMSLWVLFDAARAKLSGRA